MENDKRKKSKAKTFFWGGRGRPEETRRGAWLLRSSRSNAETFESKRRKAATFDFFGKREKKLIFEFFEFYLFLGEMERRRDGLGWLLSFFGSIL